MVLLLPFGGFCFYMKLIPVSGGKYWAKVDDKLFDYLSQFTWHYAKGGYAGRWTYPGQKHVYMHWDVLGRPPKGIYPDHINQNKLDNQRSNLRFATVGQNSANRLGYSKRSPFKGVNVRKYRFKTSYEAYIRKDGKGVKIGPFSDPHIAALMYDFWAVDLHGEYACTNFKVVKWGP